MTLAKTRTYPIEWTVSGEGLEVTFHGPNSESHAREYLAFKNGSPAPEPAAAQTAG